MRSVDPRAQERVSRQLLDALGRERMHQRVGVVVRGLKELGIEIAKQTDHVRIPRPPEVRASSASWILSFS